MPKLERWGFQEYMFEVCELEAGLVSEPIAWRIAQLIHPQHGDRSDIDLAADARTRLSTIEHSPIAAPQYTHQFAKDVHGMVERSVGYWVQELSYEYQLEGVLVNSGLVAADTSPKVMKQAKNEYERKQLLEYWQQVAHESPDRIPPSMLETAEVLYRRAQKQHAQAVALAAL